VEGLETAGCAEKCCSCISPLRGKKESEEMERQRALGELAARTRDFHGWSCTREERPSIERGEEHIEAQEQFIRRFLPIIAKADMSAWVPGGYKRVQLEEAFAELGLSPLNFE
jgi:hypothetical protein